MSISGLSSKSPAAAVVAALVCLAAGGCASPAAPADLQVTVLAAPTDARGDITGEATFVVQDADTLARVWPQVFGRERPVPAVDFSQHTVAIVTMGPQPTAGYTIEITGVTASRGGGVTVQVRTTSPGAGCIVAQVVTRPATASRLRRTDGPVRFEFTRRTRDCAGR